MRGILVTSRGPTWASGGQTSPMWSVDFSAMLAMAPTCVDLIPSHLSCHLRPQYAQVLDAARPAPRRNAQRWPALAVRPVRRPATRTHRREEPTAASVPAAPKQQPSGRYRRGPAGDPSPNSHAGSDQTVEQLPSSLPWGHSSALTKNPAGTRVRGAGPAGLTSPAFSSGL